MCICMAESLLCSPETVTILLICYTSTQNKKDKTKKKTTCASSARGVSSNPGWGIKSPCATQKINPQNTITEKSDGDQGKK